MLDLERRVVAGLLSTEDAVVRRGVEEFVDASLADMPEVLRAGVAIESIAFGAVVRGIAAVRGAIEPADLVAALDASPLPPVRQYVRLLRSLVLFAEQELTEAAVVRR